MITKRAEQMVIRTVPSLVNTMDEVRPTILISPVFDQRLLLCVVERCHETDEVCVFLDVWFVERPSNFEVDCSTA